MIKIENLSFNYENKAVFNGLSLKLPKSGVIAVTGPSGSGKTTLLRLIAGLIKPSSGRVVFDANKRVSDYKIAMVFQEDRLLPWRTARENIVIALTADTVNKQQLADEWLEKVGLEGQGGEYPLKLSGGMQRRVTLARAAAYGSDILLLDEPFKGLDAALRESVIRHIKTAAPLIIMVTHDIKEAELMGAAVVNIESLANKNQTNLRISQ